MGISESSKLEPDHESLSTAPPFSSEQEDRDAGPYLAHLASTLAAHGGGTLSADLALDLVLNEIVEQARLASTAGSAAIALLSDDELICRATTGPNAPGLGVRLAVHSGLTGACVATRQPQRCDDTQVDGRVDAAAYRNLEIRSILVVPILSGEQLLGVFQIFSPRANEFGDREVQTLQAFSLRIVNNVRYAAESQVTSQLKSERVVEPAVNALPDVEAQPVPTLLAGIATEKARRTDYWTSALTGLVIALALILGWIAGHSGHLGGIDKATDGGRVSTPAPASTSEPPQPAPLIADAHERTVGNPAIPSAADREGVSNAGLVVYEKGKIIYRATPEAGASATKEASPAKQKLLPETASTLLIHRVDPEYPEGARGSGIEGEVSMLVIVDTEGVVREVKVESGDPQLVPSAVDAVRQWRFTPYQVNGSSKEFQAHVVVRFKLP